MWMLSRAFVGRLPAMCPFRKGSRFAGFRRRSLIESDLRLPFARGVNVTLIEHDFPLRPGSNRKCCSRRNRRRLCP